MGDNNQFTELCRDSGLDDLEKRIAVWTRNLDSAATDQWTETENVLLQLHLDLSTLDRQSIFPTDGKQDLAATLLARATGNAQRVDADYPGHELSTLASFSFAAAGNFSTASIYARNALKEDSTKGPFETWALGALASTMRDIELNIPSPLSEYINTINQFFSDGLLESFHKSSSQLLLFYKKSGIQFPDFDRYLFLYWEIIQKRIGELCAARVLREANLHLPQYISTLRRKTSPLLFPTQVKAIRDHRLLESSKNALVLLPTSTGKSLLGELAILSSLAPERPLGVYLAPYRALADQLYRRMRPRLESIGIDCEMRRGGYLSKPNIAKRNARTVLIATPEAFDGILRANPQLLPKIACCVFDEFHLIEQGARGLRYEGLVARISASIPEQRARIIALSPVLTLSKNLTNWLDTDEQNVILSDWRPTGRRLAIAGPNRKIHYYTPGERLRESNNPTAPDWSGTTAFPNPVQYAPQVNYSHIRKAHAARVLENVVAVTLEQYKRLSAPILVVSTARAESRAIASKLRDELPPLPPENPLCLLAADIGSRFPHLHTLRECLRHGVAYHNAALPSWVRGQLEAALENQTLRIVASTTTLAEGVDLPFRAVIMANWRRYIYGTSSPIPTLLFRNIAGRCGRAGVFPEGDTIIVDSPSDSPSENYQQRSQEYFRLYIKPPDIQLISSLERALTLETEAARQKAIKELQPAIESHFAAHLHSFIAIEEEQEEAFTSLFLASHTKAAQEELLSIVTSLTQDMLSTTDYPTMTRNSPLELTDLGRTIVATGLSPRSGITLTRLISAYTAEEEPRRGKTNRTRHGIGWDPLTAAVVNMAIREASISELQTDTFERVGKRGYPITKTNLIDIVLAWISGLPITTIAFLTTREKTLRDSVTTWLTTSTGSPPIDFEDDLEQVSTFCSSYLSEQWGWVIKAGAHIAEHLGRTDIKHDLEKLAVRMEFGVKHEASAAILRRKCPIDRSKVDALVGLYLFDSPDADLNLSNFAKWLQVVTPDKYQSTVLGPIFSASEIGALSASILDEEFE